MFPLNIVISVDFKYLKVKKIMLLKYNLEKKTKTIRKFIRISKPPIRFHDEFDY
jgi:hypothetical protein